MTKLKLNSVEKARLRFLESQEKECGECGKTKLKKLFQIRKVYTRKGILGFYPARICTECENTAKRAATARNNGTKKTLAGSPGNKFLYQMPIVPMAAELRETRRLG